MSGPDLADLGRVHIVGIGGAGMSGIASILAARGVHVTGSDAKESRRVQSLRALGIEVTVGHQKSISADTLVYSTAIPESNSERRFAREHSIPEMSRATALASVMSGRRGVAVCVCLGDGPAEKESKGVRVSRRTTARLMGGGDSRHGVRPARATIQRHRRRHGSTRGSKGGLRKTASSYELPKEWPIGHSLEPKCTM